MLKAKKHFRTWVVQPTVTMTLVGILNSNHSGVFGRKRLSVEDSGAGALTKTTSSQAYPSFCQVTQIVAWAQSHQVIVIILANLNHGRVEIRGAVGTESAASQPCPSGKRSCPFRRDRPRHNTVAENSSAHVDPSVSVERASHTVCMSPVVSLMKKYGESLSFTHVRQYEYR